MAAIASLAFDQPAVDPRFWPQLARAVQGWLDEQGLAARDAVVLLPHARLLAHARAAFAAGGGWPPRIETAQTLAASLGPAGDAGAGPSLEPTRDRLVAARMLQAEPGLAAWSRRDAQAFEQAVARVVDATHALARAFVARAPASRGAWAARAREDLAPLSGPGATERLLARVALEWALLADTTAVDRLFALQPSAWIALRCGGAEPLTESLLEAACVPALRVDADGSGERGHGLPPQRLCCDGLEEEAQASTDAVLRALDEGRAPVALIAQDRLLVRRIRALLDRFGLRVRDETGWTLSTTRSAAQVMALLRAAGDHGRAAAGALSGAAADRWLDWLKGDALADPAALAALERSWRRGEGPQGSAQRLLEASLERLQPLAQPGRRPLAAWLPALRQALRPEEGSLPLAADAAGRQLLTALRLDEALWSADWRALAQDTRMDLEGLRAWVDEVLEQENFVPPDDEGSDAEVVITPMGRALLRPFARVVFPGTDERRLGAVATAPPLLPQALAAELGVETAALRREREALALRQLLRVDGTLLLRRRSEDGEALSASPLVERALRALQREGVALPDERPAALAVQRVLPQPVSRPAPQAPQALPERLSASSVQALRDCPYRFFARAVLRLSEAEELDGEIDKRDYGSWLHAVLHQFHRQRGQPADAASELSRLQQAADEQQRSLAIEPAELLPFRAAFAAWAPAYVAWLHERDAAGWRWHDGELWLEQRPPALPGVLLHGRIDRVDHGAGERLQLIDYKTGSLAELKQRVAEPFEDTQLAFYAALMAATPQALSAAYLVLDERGKPTEVAHEEVQATAEALLQHLGGELERLRAGAGLPALGEGRICDTCEARGLCRRDDWSMAA